MKQPARELVKAPTRSKKTLFSPYVTTRVCSYNLYMLPGQKIVKMAAGAVSRKVSHPVAGEIIGAPCVLQCPNAANSDVPAKLR